MLILILLLVIWLMSIINQMIIINKGISPNNCVLIYFKINFKLVKCVWYNFMWCSLFLLIMPSQVVTNQYYTRKLPFSFLSLQKALFITNKYRELLCVFLCSSILFSVSQTCYFRFYVMLFLGDKQWIFFISLCLQIPVCFHSVRTWV